MGRLLYVLNTSQVSEWQPCLMFYQAAEGASAYSYSLHPSPLLRSRHSIHRQPWHLQVSQQSFPQIQPTLTVKSHRPLARASAMAASFSAGVAALLDYFLDTSIAMNIRLNMETHNASQLQVCHNANLSHHVSLIALAHA